MAERNISGFKKFSDLRSTEKIKEGKLKEVDLGERPDTDSDRPMLPNLPKDSTKTPKPMSQKKIIPKDQDIGSPSEESVNEDKKVKMYGKVAKFPKMTKASKAYNFLENVKISKNSIWYILVEKQENELQMVKYNNKKGFDLGKFVAELKTFYLNQYADQPKMVKLIESIEMGGKSEFSTIRNIPNIDINGKKLITKITEDLIRLLSR